MIGQIEALIAFEEMVIVGTFPADLTGPEMGFPNTSAATLYSAFSGSLDAAMRLHDSVVPEWRPRLELGGCDAFGNARPADVWTVILWHKDHMSHLAITGPRGQSNNPARAWLLAIIRAKLAELEGA